MSEEKTIYGTIEKKSSEDGVGKNGNPYTRCVYVIDSKNYSTFDKKIIDKFKVGDKVKVDLKKSGDYWNMESMIIQEDGVDNADNIKPEKVGVQKPSNVSTTMYTSYAKDIFIAMIPIFLEKGTKSEEGMDLCVDIVKRARDSF